MDIIDRAQEADREFQKKAIDAFRKRQNFYSFEPTESQMVVDGIAYCVDCGLDIDARRLEAKPDAVRCVECQEKKERR